MRQPQAVHGLYRRTLHQALAAHQGEDALIHRGGQVISLFISLGRHQWHAEHHVGLVEHGRRLEVVAVHTNRFVHVARGEMRSEGVG
ncbi:hypothetical protein D9M71_378990 [compost metagenome]